MLGSFLAPCATAACDRNHCLADRWFASFRPDRNSDPQEALVALLPCQFGLWEDFALSQEFRKENCRFGDQIIDTRWIPWRRKFMKLDHLQT